MLNKFNGVSEAQFENSFTLTKWFLLLSGIKISQIPFNKYVDHFLNYQLFYYDVIILHTVVFGEVIGVIDCIQTGKTIVELSFNMPCITISTLATVKILFLFINRETLLDLYYKLKEIHCVYDRDDFKDGMVEDRQKIVLQAVNMLRAFVSMICIIYVIVIVMFCLVPVLLMGYHYSKTAELVVIYPYLVKYPFFEVYKSSWWPLVYFHQVSATFVACLSLFSSETLLFAFCSYIVMHFRLLGLQFENIVSSSKEETEKKLKKAVKRHQELIHLVNLTEVLYSKSSLFHMVTASFLICLSAFIITIADEMNVKFAFFTFLMMSLSQISLDCFFADMLMRSSTEISGSVYKSTWYEAEGDAKKIMLLVILRSQKACKLTAWRFVDLNLGAFTRILSTSWSYFALLKSMYN